MNECVKFAFFLFFIPLYSKIKREKLLDNFLRGAIYQHIKENPGTHYNYIKRTVGIENGVLAFHLNKLEKENFIKSVKDGKLRRFYLAEFKIERKVILTEKQRKIAHLIRERPGINQIEIAKRLKISQQALSYQIKQLILRGVIKFEEKGRQLKYYYVYHTELDSILIN